MDTKHPDRSAPSQGTALAGTRARAYTATEMNALADSGRELLIETPLPIPRGSRIVVHARENEGKSMLVLKLCVALALAGKRVVVFVGEGGIVASRDRLRGICAAYGRTLDDLGDRLLCVVGCATVDSEEGAQALEAAMALFNPDVLVLDPMASFFGGDENRADQVGAFLRALDVFSLAGITIMLIAHDRKSGRFTARDIRGTSATRAWADCVWGIFTEHGVTWLAHEKERDAARDGDRKMRLRFDAGAIDVELGPPGKPAGAPPRKPAAIAMVKTRILAVLARGPASNKQLRAKVPQSGGMIGNALRALKTKGAVSVMQRPQRDTRGRRYSTLVYALTPKKKRPA